MYRITGSTATSQEEYQEERNIMTSNRLGMQSLEMQIGYMRCPHEGQGIADSRESIEDTIHLRQITCSLKIP